LLRLLFPHCSATREAARRISSQDPLITSLDCYLITSWCSPIGFWLYVQQRLLWSKCKDTGGAGFSRAHLLDKRALNAPPGTSVCLPYTRITLLWAAQPSIPTSGSISAFIINNHLSLVQLVTYTIYLLLCSSRQLCAKKKHPTEFKPPKCVPTAPPQTHHTTMTLHAANTPSSSMTLRPRGLFSHL
jgi:hypothetical protein